jgi:hypothetical protein
MKPWLTKKAIEWMNGYLQPYMRVFEWGSGLSTAYFSEMVGEVISVEHSPFYFEYTRGLLEPRSITNVQLTLIEPQIIDNVPAYGLQSYTSKTFEIDRDKSFENYVRSIDTFPDHYFDFVLVDGRSRASCVYHALNKIKNNGYLLLDNSGRGHYNCIFGFMKGFEKMNLKDEWSSTLWRISR